MKFLLDVSAYTLQRRTEQHPGLVGGQLLTPLTNYKLSSNAPFAVDNGAYTSFDRNAYLRLLDRVGPFRQQCLFVAAPDIVGSARRTLEAFGHWSELLMAWPLALVAQDGIEDLPIPWDSLKAIFIGGTTEWKDSKAAADVVKCAKILSKHVHIGRVNQNARYRRFQHLGADTCDGSGACRFDEKINAIARADHGQPLFSADSTRSDSTGCCGERISNGGKSAIVDEFRFSEREEKTHADMEHCSGRQEKPTPVSC